MNYPSRETVERIKLMYPKGTRVELVLMDDPYRIMPPGLQGTVVAVDDMATVHVTWDNGSTLGAAYGIDRIRKLYE